MEKPESVDAYFASLEPSRRASLQKLRETIAAAAPGAEEGITYGMPGFLLTVADWSATWGSNATTASSR